MNQAHVLIFDEIPPKGFLGIRRSVGRMDIENGKQKDTGPSLFGPQNRAHSLRRERAGEDTKEKEAPGTGKSPLISDLHLWGNFRVRDLLHHFYPGKEHATIFSMRERGAFRRLLKFLEKREEKERLIVGRTDNVTLLDWNGLLSIVRGTRNLVKLQVGKIPSDLYVLRKQELIEVAAGWEKGEAPGSQDFLSWLFDGFLFHNFEKILDVGGFSFLLRNSYEYHRENILIADSLGSKRYADLYRRLPPGSLANITVTESGDVSSSVLGGGVKVEGVVRGSVIFSGVTIGKSSVVRDSVILPSNTIEEGVTLQNTLVLEGNRRVIGGGCSIGGTREAQNRMYPDILKQGLTIIGEGVEIPSDSRIGAGCLVTGSGEGPERPIDLDDGEVYNSDSAAGLL
jgi:hypothetical protein